MPKVGQVETQEARERRIEEQKAALRRLGRAAAEGDERAQGFLKDRFGIRVVQPLAKVRERWINYPALRAMNDHKWLEGTELLVSGFDEIWAETNPLKEELFELD